MKYLMFSFLWWRARGAEQLNTQYLQKSAENRERSVLTLGSLWHEEYYKILFQNETTKYVEIIQFLKAKLKRYIT